MLIDTHTHVNFQPFLNDATAVLQRALDHGIGLINVGTQWESSQRSVELAQSYPERVWAAVGVHPIHLFSDITEQQEIEGQVQHIRTRAERFDYERYKDLANSSPKVVAIGECGLDYLHFERAQLQHQREELIKLQRDTLEQHIALAIELDKAIIIHCRDAQVHQSTDVQAFVDLLEILRPYQGKLRGTIHCYTGPTHLVADFLALGFYIGFTGIITFAKSTEVRAAVQAVPLNRLLLETDAPYLTPIPYRGKRNEPLYVQYVAKSMAELKSVSADEIAQHTTANAVELFRLS